MCDTKFLQHWLKFGIPEAVFRRCFSKNGSERFCEFTRKHQCWSLFLIKLKAWRPVTLFNKLKGLKACNFITKRLQHRCFPVKFEKLLRRPSFTEHLRWLLFGFQKTDTRPFSYQKADTKRNPWVAIY